ncbi:MAG: SRPBCC domain-containing protein [Phycisphaerales bacterium]|nr:SRPBCC domain-containing protein [Phycisphaerales bacterium]
MSVRKDKNGQRSVQAEIEVPGSPEEVWRAIATGAGVSSWFVPTKIEEREGGAAVSSFGPGMDAPSKITAWNPPDSYTTEAGEEGQGPGKVATEWIVEARSGGTCLVRVVHRWFADTDDWDGEFEGHAYGWATSFFRMLNIYLTNFAGQKSVAFDLAAFNKASGPETWKAIKSAVHIDDNLKVKATAGAPSLSGTQERLEVTDPDLLRIRESSPMIAAALDGMGDESPELLLKLDRPAPGFAHIFIMPMGEITMVSMRFYLFGDDAAAAAEQAKSEWNEWLAEKFPQEAAG